MPRPSHPPRSKSRYRCPLPGALRFGLPLAHPPGATGCKGRRYVLINPHGNTSGPVPLVFASRQLLTDAATGPSSCLPLEGLRRPDAPTTLRVSATQAPKRTRQRNAWPACAAPSAATAFQATAATFEARLRRLEEATGGQARR